MAKKLADIQKSIDSSANAFYKYLRLLLHDDMMEKFDSLTQITDVYLFSGIIRNYFLKIYLKRDVDIVLGKEIDVELEFNGLPIKKNSFGGYKVIFPSSPLDLWFIKDTWAFQHSQKTLEFDLEKKIPDTAFFNFSAIIYSLNKKEFYYNDDFLKFMRDKKLDYVYEYNPNYGLCIVNTFYYSEKYKLGITDRLFSFIKKLYLENTYDFYNIQMKHFNQVLYSDNELEKRIMAINK